MTARIFSLHSEDKHVKMSLAGHRDYVVKAFFNQSQEIIYTVSKDGAIFRWEYTERPGEEDLPEEIRILNNLIPIEKANLLQFHVYIHSKVFL